MEGSSTSKISEGPQMFWYAAQVGMGSLAEGLKMALIFCCKCWKMGIALLCFTIYPPTLVYLQLPVNCGWFKEFVWQGVLSGSMAQRLLV